MSQADAIRKNEQMWDAIATADDEWFPVVSESDVQSAREGQMKINVTAQVPVPSEWLTPLRNRDVLCLAAGGGRQGPLLAAAGAVVTVFDLSKRQLERDQFVAERDSLNLQTEHGDMRDLSLFEDGSFDWVVNPCSLCYCPEVLPVWRECYRVLKVGGSLITGLINPVNFLFDEVKATRGEFVVAHRIPYSDLDLTEDQREKVLGHKRPIRFGHSLAEMLGGLTQTGFLIDGLFEDRWGMGDPLSQRIELFLGVRATRFQ